ncbi:MAG: glycosyltransferase, partial [Alphaproteobacteria bacterium]
MQTSVLTLVRGRRDHLTQLMNGLSRQRSKPSELVIAWMQPEPLEDLPDPGCPVRHVMVAGDALPLAKARNRAAEVAKGELLIFLDVDCIPSPGLVSAYKTAAASRNGLFLGEVLYLAAGASQQPLDFAELDRVGVTHPSKPAVPSTGVRVEPDVGQLWGLSFALRRQD